LETRPLCGVLPRASGLGMGTKTNIAATCPSRCRLLVMVAHRLPFGTTGSYEPSVLGVRHIRGGVLGCCCDKNLPSTLWKDKLWREKSPVERMVVSGFCYIVPPTYMGLSARPNSCRCSVTARALIFVSCTVSFSQPISKGRTEPPFGGPLSESHGQSQLWSPSPMIFPG
jgi:hypothetical protein